MIEKIKAVRNDFSSGSGPAQITTLGFKDTTEGEDYILGVFYLGNYMDKDADQQVASCERTIDRIIRAAKEYKRST